jgi:hypothetical protein
LASARFWLIITNVKRGDRVERDDHRQQPVRVVLDAEADPAAEPDDVQIDKRHRAGEARDRVGDPLAERIGVLLGLLDQRRVDRRRGA